MSTDSGASWDAVNIGLPSNTIVRALVQDSAGNLYAGTDGSGVHKMTFSVDPIVASPTVGSIAAPSAVKVGGKLSLTAPDVADNGGPVTTQGW